MSIHSIWKIWDCKTIWNPTSTIPLESATVRHIWTCKITRQTEICSKSSILVLFTIVKLSKPNWNMAKIPILEPAAKYFLQVCHGYIKDQWPYPNQYKDIKPQCGTSIVLQSPKWGIKVHAKPQSGPSSILQSPNSRF